MGAAILGFGRNSLHLLLGPLEILANFASIAETVLESFSRLREASLRLLLELKKLAVLGI